MTGHEKNATCLYILQEEEEDEEENTKRFFRWLYYSGPVSHTRELGPYISIWLRLKNTNK